MRKKNKRTLSLLLAILTTMMNISSEEIAKIYRNKIWKLHGILKKVLSNRKPQFTLRFMEKFTKALGTTRQLLIIYHSQTDRQMERINQEIGIFL